MIYDSVAASGVFGCGMVSLTTSSTTSRLGNARVRDDDSDEREDREEH